MKSITRSPWVRGFVVALAYLCCAELGHAVSFPGAGFATFWPANGLLLVALLISPRSQWPLLLLWTAAVNHFTNVVWHGQPPVLSLMFTTANALECFGAALTLNFWARGRLRMENLQHMLVMIGCGGFLFPMLGATIGSLALQWQYGDVDLAITWRLWWASDALGMLVVAPLCLVWLANSKRSTEHWTAPRLMEFVFVAALLVLLTIRIFGSPQALFPIEEIVRIRFPVVLIPVLIWITLRFGVRGATLGNATVACLVIGYTVAGHGPFATVAREPSSQALVLQGYLSILTLIALTLGAGLAEQKHSAQRQTKLAEALRAERRALQEQKDLLQAILNSIDDGVIMVNHQGDFLQFNPGAMRICGQDASQFKMEEWSSKFQIYRADGQTQLAQHELPLVRVLLGEVDVPPITVVIKRPTGGEERVVAATARPVYDRDRQTIGAVVAMHDITEQANVERERERLIAELQHALGEIKTLRGLIPICASCKSVRDDKGYWQKIEAFLHKHTDAEFSHGICDGCGVKLYGTLWTPEMTIPALPETTPAEASPHSRVT
ncbi:MAG TPA: MASE1 domain-containing protein [Pirellulaceae bacterium]|nr:MASE1 domain-containing protein [Pirellulaceae bacterium]